MLLNKVDLFTKKINNTAQHLRLFFSKYTGPDHIVPATQKLIQDQFLDRNSQKHNKLIYSHFTTATDTNNIKTVFKVVLETIVRKVLEKEELL